MPAKKKKAKPTPQTVTREISEQLSNIAAAWAAIGRVVVREADRLVGAEHIEIRRGK